MPRISARATVNLQGFPAGQTRQVDPTDPRVKGLLASGLLVDESPPAPEPRPARRSAKPPEPSTPPEQHGEPADSDGNATTGEGAAEPATE